MFTLSGAHVFPMYDAAVIANPPLPIIDVRHEPSAVFAAEAVGDERGRVILHGERPGSGTTPPVLADVGPTDGVAFTDVVPDDEQFGQPKHP